MSGEFEGSEELLARTANFVEDHRDLYISSGGTQGHIVNFAHVGVDGYLPALLLQTTGRKSHRTSIVPLIYGCYAGEWIVVGSKGGAPEHPGWYFNLSEQPKVVFQVGAQAFEASWRELAGDEYREVWAYMEKHYPPYRDYVQSAAGRTIPLIALRPRAPAVMPALDAGAA